MLYKKIKKEYPKLTSNLSRFVEVHLSLEYVQRISSIDVSKYDAIIVGAGVAGAVSARRLSDAGMKVLLIDKREHIAGNCYDYKNSDGVLIHKYGPHIFHTNSQTVYEFLSRFTEWYQYHHEVVANVNGKYLPVPFNLNTLKVIYDSQKADSLRKKLINKNATQD